MQLRLPRRAVLSLAAAAALLPRAALARPTMAEATAEAAAARSATSSLSDLLELQEWAAFRRQLRYGPMGRVRAACSALAAAAQPTVRAEAEGAYRRLVKAVEDADYAALQRERGGSQDVETLLRGIEAAFDRFLGLVEGG